MAHRRESGFRVSVEYSETDHIVRIELNRPDRLNATDPTLIDELCRALEAAIVALPAVAVISGRGRAFCAGHDLTYETVDVPYAVDRLDVERTHDITRLIRRAPFPVVSSVHGYALGAGCEIALCSDLVIAADDAVFGFPEVSVGLSITGGISRILPHAVGLAKAKELIFLGQRFGAAQAQSWGLVNFVVPGASLVEETDHLTKQISRLPAHALGLAKSALNVGFDGSLDTAFEIETLHALETRSAQEARDATEKFLQRR